jgi:hypothetical protein
MDNIKQEFAVLTEDRLAEINGGSKRDYDFFYDIGSAIRKGWQKGKITRPHPFLG